MYFLWAVDGRSTDRVAGVIRCAQTYNHAPVARASAPTHLTSSPPPPTLLHLRRIFPDQTERKNRNMPLSAVNDPPCFRSAVGRFSEFEFGLLQVHPSCELMDSGPKSLPKHPCVKRAICDDVLWNCVPSQCDGPMSNILFGNFLIKLNHFILHCLVYKLIFYADQRGPKWMILHIKNLFRTYLEQNWMSI